MAGKTLYDKIWDAHVAHEAEDGAQAAEAEQAPKRTAGRKV